MTQSQFNYPNKRFKVMVESEDGEVYEGNLDSVIADITSDRRISNDEAFKLIQNQWQNAPEDGTIQCPHKKCQFWVEQEFGYK